MFQRKQKPRDFNEYFNSGSEEARVAMLKKRVPHLMYGPSQEYGQIFKKDPERLLSIAKSKLR